MVHALTALPDEVLWATAMLPGYKRAPEWGTLLAALAAAAAAADAAAAESASSVVATKKRAATGEGTGEGTR